MPGAGAKFVLSKGSECDGAACEEHAGRGSPHIAYNATRGLHRGVWNRLKRPLSHWPDQRRLGSPPAAEGEP
jgi:hypothetical protein